MKHLLHKRIHCFKHYRKFLKPSAINCFSFDQYKSNIFRKLSIYLTHPQYAYRLGLLKIKSWIANITYNVSSLVHLGEQHKY